MNEPIDTTTAPPNLNDPIAPSAPESGPGVQDVIRQAREQLADGTAPILSSSDDTHNAPDVPTAVDEQATEEQATEDIGLPEGFKIEADGRIRGPDGRFYSEEQVAEMVVAAEAASQHSAQPEQPTIDAATHDLAALLPGRQPDDPDFEVRITPELRQAFQSQGIDPQAFVERVNQLRNGYVRGEKARQMMDEARQLQQETQGLIVGLEHDPVNTILGRIPESVRADLVRHLLADDAVWNAVNDDLITWDSDEQERRAAWAELRAKRYEQSQQAREQIAQRQAVEENARQITEAIESLIPEHMSREQATVFLRYAHRDLIEYVNQNGINRLDPAEVPILLHRLGTLQPFGVAVNGNGGPAVKGGASNPVAPQPSAAVAQHTAAPKPAAAPTVPAPKVTADVGAKFRAALERRRAAAAVAPAGAGATPTRLQPPPGQTVKERIAWLRQQQGLS